ncbi:MAG: hypothetical protein L6R40_003615 [Gallowayella cf. fulva]|nr:MAG: hypothetical protein L6R40_003615 [Xanthomendoza cf. fulva]
MFKVQNGLQAHNLNELEAMASRKATPPPTLSQIQPSVFPSTFSATQSPHSPGKVYSNLPLTPNGPRSAHQYPQLQHSFLSPSPQDVHVGEVYRGPILAPPVDILPGTSRRPRADNMQRPRLNTTNAHPPGSNDLLSPMGSATTPATPPRGPASTVRTPSQKSAMEQDAVETLMFMSSPGNSGYHPAFHAPMSPLPKHSITSPSRVDFASYGARPPPNANKVVHAARLGTTAEIDKALDEMPDRYSSSDEDVPYA